MVNRKEADRENGRLRVFLVEDHPLTRRGLAAVINGEPDLLVCGEAGSAEEASARISGARPDVVTVDITLGGLDGIELIKEIRDQHPSLPMLVVSMHDEFGYADRALRAGAHGYIMKSEPAERIVAAIRRVLAGEVYVSERSASRLLSMVVGGRHKGEQSPLERLTDRELEVFQSLGQGLSVRQIAEKLYRSVKTIEAHREHIKQKLNCQNSTELLRYAIQHVELGR